MRLTSARLSATEKDRLNGLLKGTTFSCSRVTNIREAAQTKVMPPEIEYTRLLESLEVTSSSRDYAKPHWLRFIAAHKAFLTNCIFRCTDESCESVYKKFMVAGQHDPMWAVFVKLCVDSDAELDPRLCAKDMKSRGTSDSRWAFLDGCLLKRVLQRFGCGRVDGCSRDRVCGERHFVATVVRAAGCFPTSSEATRQMGSPRINLPRNL